MEASPTPNPQLVDWVERTEHGIVTLSADMRNRVVGMIPYHSKVDPSPRRSSFLHGGTDLFDSQEHFHYGFQDTSGMSLARCFTHPFPTKPGARTLNGTGAVRELVIKTWSCIPSSLGLPRGLGFLRGKPSVD